MTFDEGTEHIKKMSAKTFDCKQNLDAGRCIQDKRNSYKYLLGGNNLYCQK